MFDIYFIYYLEGQGRWFKSIAESEPEETYLKVMDILSILINNVVGWWPKRPFNQSNTVGPTPGVEIIFYFLGPQENIENFWQIIK